MAKQVGKGNTTLGTGALGVREPADHGDVGTKGVVRKPDAMTNPVSGGANGLPNGATHAGLGRMGADSHLGPEHSRGGIQSATKSGLGRRHAGSGGPG